MGVGWDFFQNLLFVYQNFRKFPKVQFNYSWGCSSASHAETPSRGCTRHDSKRELARGWLTYCWGQPFNKALGHHHCWELLFVEAVGPTQSIQGVHCVWKSLRVFKVCYVTKTLLSDYALKPPPTLQQNTVTLKIPSSYFLTDCYLYLDLLLKKKLYRPTAGKTRADLAGAEGVKAKRLLQSLRNLWRSPPGGAHDERLVSLKSFLMPSPPRGRVPSLLLKSFMESILWFFGAPFFFLTSDMTACPAGPGSVTGCFSRTFWAAMPFGRWWIWRKCPAKTVEWFLSIMNDWVTLQFIATLLYYEEF